MFCAPHLPTRKNLTFNKNHAKFASVPIVDLLFKAICHVLCAPLSLQFMLIVHFCKITKDALRLLQLWNSFKASQLNNPHCGIYKEQISSCRKCSNGLTINHASSDTARWYVNKHYGTFTYGKWKQNSWYCWCEAELLVL